MYPFFADKLLFHPYHSCYSYICNNNIITLVTTRLKYIFTYLHYKRNHKKVTLVPMNTDKHYERLRESLEVLEESIEKDIIKRQRTIGFNCSAAAVDMLEIHLHKEKLIDPGFVLKHEWFKSKRKIKDKLPFEFKNKNKILRLMDEIETKRNALCYGTPQSETIVKQVIIKFNSLKKIMNELGVKTD